MLHIVTEERAEVLRFIAEGNCRLLLCTKTTHVREWIVISNLPARIHIFESHQLTLMEFKDAVIAV